jgi:hypothetical protein
MLIDEQQEKAEMDSYRRMQQQPQARALPTASKQEKYPSPCCHETKREMR